MNLPYIDMTQEYKHKNCHVYCSSFSLVIGCIISNLFYFAILPWTKLLGMFNYLWYTPQAYDPIPKGLQVGKSPPSNTECELAKPEKTKLVKSGSQSTRHDLGSHVTRPKSNLPSLTNWPNQAELPWLARSGPRGRPGWALGSARSSQGAD